VVSRLIDRGMPFKVAAFYQFVALPDFRELREPLRGFSAGLGLKGSVLLAAEGINGTLAGSGHSIATLVEELQRGTLFGGRLDDLQLKYSHAEAMPFGRMKVRLKKEIVTLGDKAVDPTKQVGIYVEPSNWNALITSPDTLVIDTRNTFEVAMGNSGISLPSASIPPNTQKSRCSAPAASAARRQARCCSRGALPRSITSRAVS
jgi:UPF0176 protein